MIKWPPPTTSKFWLRTSVKVRERCSCFPPKPYYYICGSNMYSIAGDNR
jgi:hypothetical protein